jgi:RNA polymerase sigma-70 factor (ECF subfamily)
MEEFYKKYQKSIKRVVSQKINDEGVAEELTNDILLAGFQSLPSFNGKSSEFSWLCAIAKHKIIDYYRKKKLKTILFSVSPLFEEIADKALGPEKESLREELQGEVRKTLREVRTGYKKILRLKYLEGLKIKQIAKLMKLSVKAVESRLMRAKKQFKKDWAYDERKIK